MYKRASVIFATFLALSAVVLADTPVAPDNFPNVASGAYQLRYAANVGPNNPGGSVVNLTNAGTEGAFDGTFGQFPNGNICVNVYVFDAFQEMLSCCTCPLTPNSLKTLDVKRDLLGNTTHGPNPADAPSVTVKLLATLPQNFSPTQTAAPRCDAGNPSGSANAVNSCGPNTVGAPGCSAMGLRAWMTTLHLVPVQGFAVTETEFSKAVLTLTERDKVQGACLSFQRNLSGRGICNACLPGALAKE